MAADTAVAELIEWHHAEQLPDADTTVLLWVVCSTEQDWCSGWWDGDCWRDCASGGEVAGRVTHWATVDGPAT